ncbi:MAG TPA: alkyl sulfatase dimerization domain-containing protein [Solirubrobacteraceae bacterium]|nr:alkyl sulfatase dimerization domain-containing protein [Solirubrobacteraceae bacterium]
MTDGAPAGHIAASQHIAEANNALRMRLPFEDREDFEDARRGFVAKLSPAVVQGTGGRVVWDMESYAFLEEQCPSTVNPSLWRQAQLNAIHGLFEVVPGIYQVRGLDLSNMTIVEGHEGVLVIDPLICAETAAAALELYRAHRGLRPVTGLLYTHCHVDHFGGALGVVDPEDVAAGRVPVLAPVGFLEHAISENVYAGTAMARRAAYMFGSLIDRNPAGQVGTGLGMTVSTGSVGIVAPTLEIAHTGHEEAIDGIRMLFQMTPGSEAPAEMNFLFPDHRALCIAENATHNLHNIITPRGALVRDARLWSRYLGEAIDLFGERADALFAGHQWPRWGRERIVEMLALQRDLYGYLHDQTLRLLNKGYVGSEIAELLRLPPGLAREWHCREYYGTVSHNVKGIYQRYMGWFDGNPAHLWQHPPEQAASRYVEAMGGSEAVLEQGRRAFAEGDYRWVAELMAHAVFADPSDEAARELEAQALEQLAYGAENATWRNIFLTGARELREGVIAGGAAPSRHMVAMLTTEQLFDVLAIRIDGPRAGERRLRFNWVFTDTGERHVLSLSNGVLIHSPDRQDPAADATVVVERSALNELLAGLTPMPELAQAGRLRVEGDGAKLVELLGLLDEPDPSFAIVTP